MKKINQEALEFAREKCYEQILFEPITRHLREVVKAILRDVLKEYDIDSIICDETNNSCDVIDSGRIRVQINENHPYLTETKIIHILTL